MKKSQLRKIIRESIEELMTEQTNHDQVLSDAGCYCPSGHGVYQAGGSACRFSCNNLSDPLLVAALNSNGGNGPGCYYDLSIKLCIPQVFPNGNPVFANDCCNLFESGGFGANGIGSIFNNACDGSGGFNYGFYEGSGAIPGSLPQNSPGTCESECTGPNCTSSITAAGGCDPSAWSNHANWTSTFTNTVNNANNTCNFLNIKIAQFTSQIPNVGPVWANQLQCKLDLANQLHTQNNC